MKGYSLNSPFFRSSEKCFLRSRKKALESAADASLVTNFLIENSDKKGWDRNSAYSMICFVNKIEGVLSFLNCFWIEFVTFVTPN